MLLAILRIALQACFVVLADVEHGDDGNLLGFPFCVEGDHGALLVVSRRQEPGQAILRGSCEGGHIIRKYSYTRLLSFFVTVS